MARRPPAPTTSTTIVPMLCPPRRRPPEESPALSGSASAGPPRSGAGAAKGRNRGPRLTGDSRGQEHGQADHPFNWQDVAARGSHTGRGRLEETRRVYEQQEESGE